MIDWGKIKDGANGFENLARAYVKSKFKFPYGFWKETGITRDGNKDAYTVIIGYHPYVDQDETWWMEAKYSSTEKATYLTRFRLDATIVSSVFHKRVSKIIFVTNLDVYAKTISDIRLALQRAIGCHEVYFSTRQVLEHWLMNHPSVYSTYFSEPIPPSDAEKLLFVSEDISVYPYPTSKYYVEPCTHLYIGKQYSAYFKVISNTECDVSIYSARKGIKFKPKQIHLCCGETIVQLQFMLTDKFDAWVIQNDGRQSQRLDFFTINRNCPILLKKSFEVLKRSEIQLKIDSQDKILSYLRRDSRAFSKSAKMKISVLCGASGTGKSYVVQKFMLSRSVRNEQHYYHNFSGDMYENGKRLLKVVLYILFPYVDPTAINKEYLYEIRNHIAIPESLLTLVDVQDIPDEFAECLDNFCKRKSQVLPENCDINPRYIFLDNVQNLNDTLWSFLLSIIHECTGKNCPVYFLLIGQTYFTESDAFQKLMQKHPIDIYECILEPIDVIKNIYLATSFDMTNYTEVIEDYFPNLIVLISFLKFVKLSPVLELGNINDFINLYLAFINGNMSEALVLDQFKNIMNDEEQKKLCFSVYTSPNGICVGENNFTDAYSLLQTGIVKFNEENKLVPFHDIYEGIFRKAYNISKRSLGIPYTDMLDEIRDTVLFPIGFSKVEDAAKEITSLRKSGQFHSVCYILDGYFDKTNSTLAFSSPQNAEIYYQMFFDYAYSTVNCSHKHIGYSYFEQIYSGIEHKTSTTMRLLKLDLLFELMNSNYNIFHFKEAMQKYRQFQEDIELLIRTMQIPPYKEKNEQYILCENMRILIQSSRGKKKSEQMFLRQRELLKMESYDHHYIDFSVRYAHTLYTIDPHRALKYTEEAHEYLADEGYGKTKLWCLVKFQYLYLRLLVNHDYSILTELEYVLETAKKNYYSSFRHRNLAFCAILYKIGDLHKADDRFLSDMANPRQLRDKMQGFYFETLALHHLMHGNFDVANDALLQAANVFENVPSYMRTIRHNQKVLKFKRFSPKRIDFNLGGVLKRDWYYIDPRAD